jgi:hypothetical protein
MKSHLIPEPEPIDSHIYDTDAARFYLLDQDQASDRAKSGSDDETLPAPDMSMRNFLRVVFVR